TSPEGRRLWTHARTSLTIRRFGMPLTMTMSQLTEEDDRGNLLSFVVETRNPPISHSRTTGRVVGRTLHLATTAAGRTTESTQPWEDDVKPHVWQGRILQEDPVEPGDTRSWQSFEPPFLKTGSVTLVGEEPVETELLNGTRPRLERLVLTHSVAPGVRTTL